MRYLRLTIPPLLLFLILASSACSTGGGSKISKDDANYLNQVNGVLTTLVEQLTSNVKKCSKAANPVACIDKLVSSFADQMSNSADAYDRVADNASGNCERALRVVSGDIRNVADDLSKGSPTASDQQWIADEGKMFSACNLKEVHKGGAS